MQSGLMIGPDKHYLLETRLQPIVAREGLSGLPALVDRLRQNTPDGLEQDVIEAMTTNETLFFRDDKPFAHLAGQGLAEAAAARPAGKPVRIWSAGASSGQEAYSIAMIAAENPAALDGRPVRILGTDIASRPLIRAQAGIYTQFEVQRGLPARRLIRHFGRLSDGWQIDPALQAMCEFGAANLLHDPAPLGMFDIVFCRNVLIYFSEATKRAVLAALARQLAPDGWLYLGCSETAMGFCTDLEQGAAGQPFYRLARATGTPA
jgi:chemotaxis protein methyltransferase CheR